MPSIFHFTVRAGQRRVGIMYAPYVCASTYFTSIVHRAHAIKSAMLEISPPIGRTGSPARSFPLRMPLRLQYTTASSRPLSCDRTHVMPNGRRFSPLSVVFGRFRLRLPVPCAAERSCCCSRRGEFLWMARDILAVVRTESRAKIVTPETILSLPVGEVESG